MQFHIYVTFRCYRVPFLSLASLAIAINQVQIQSEQTETWNKIRSNDTLTEYSVQPACFAALREPCRLLSIRCSSSLGRVLRSKTILSGRSIHCGRRTLRADHDDPNRTLSTQQSMRKSKYTQTTSPQGQSYWKNSSTTGEHRQKHPQDTPGSGNCYKHSLLHSTRLGGHRSSAVVCNSTPHSSRTHAQVMSLQRDAEPSPDPT